jgi:sugar phosphate isomerase/epimerase
MRLGIGSYTFGWAVGSDGRRPRGSLTAADLVRRAREMAVGVVQLCDNLPGGTWDERSIEQLAQLAGASGVSIEVGTRGTDVKHLVRFAAIASKLKSPILRLVIDGPGDHPDKAEVVRRLTAAAGAFEAASVTIAVENHDRFHSSALREILAGCGSAPVGICLDTANSFGAGEGPEAVLEALGPRVVNLHLKDFVILRLPHLQGFVIEGRPLGEGMLDVPRVLSRLRETGRDPTAVVELWTPPEPDLGATVEKEAAWAAASLRAARRWITD